MSTITATDRQGALLRSAERIDSISGSPGNGKTAGLLMVSATHGGDSIFLVSDWRQRDHVIQTAMNLGLVKSVAHSRSELTWADGSTAKVMSVATERDLDRLRGLPRDGLVLMDEVDGNLANRVIVMFPRATIRYSVAS